MKTMIFLRPHKDAEGIDEITIKQTPRFKTSELSGDEWRTSALIVMKRKGVVVYERPVHTMEDAASFLSWIFRVEAMENSKVPGLFGAKVTECFQSGCSDPSKNVYRLKEIYSSQGEGPLPKTEGFEYRRAFCEAHSHRGDSSFEDSDDNYELIKGEGGKVLRPDDISPAKFAGTIEIDPDKFLKP